MMCAKYTGIIYMCVDLLILFFFFKQKTAYEMRISDWSSDVCSSDLGPARAFGADGIPGRINRGNATRGSNDGRIYRRDGPYFGPREICALWQGDRRPERAVRRRSGRQGTGRGGAGKIGRASGRERVCQYV